MQTGLLFLLLLHTTKSGAVLLDCLLNVNTVLKKEALFQDKMREYYKLYKVIKGNELSAQTNHRSHAFSFLRTTSLDQDKFCCRSGLMNVNNVESLV